MLYSKRNKQVKNDKIKFNVAYALNFIAFFAVVSRLNPETPFGLTMFFITTLSCGLLQTEMDFGRKYTR